MPQAYRAQHAMCDLFAKFENCNTYRRKTVRILVNLTFSELGISNEMDFGVDSVRPYSTKG